MLNTIDIAPQNLDAVKKGMLGLTTEGSVARYFRDVGVQVGAKTGSAQIERPERVQRRIRLLRPL